MQTPSCVCVLACLLPAVARAQDGIDSISVPPRRAYQHSLSIVAQYDPSQGKTVIQIEPFPLDSLVSLSTLAALDGPRPRTPASSVVLTFWSRAPAGRYASNRSVHVVLDGTVVLDLGNAWVTPQPKQGYGEVLLKSLSLGKLLAMANASAVVIRLGASSFTLTDSQHQGLRDFASRLAPESR